MSRARLRHAVASRRSERGAVVPLIGSHAARLEQIPRTAFLSDPELQARALRNAQALYGTDAVTLGAGLDTLALAVHAALRPGAPAAELERVAAARAPVAELPHHDAVLSQLAVQVELEALRRLRPVLGERAGIVLATPAPDHLAAQLGDAGAEAWCGALLMRLVRLFGAEEPDLLITVGERDPGPRLGAMCEHFSLAHLHLGPAPPDGVDAVAGSAFVESTSSGARAAWLHTTRDEIPTETEPARLRQAVARLQAGEEALVPALPDGPEAGLP